MIISLFSGPVISKSGITRIWVLEKGGHLRHYFCNFMNILVTLPSIHNPLRFFHGSAYLLPRSLLVDSPQLYFVLPRHVELFATGGHVYALEDFFDVVHDIVLLVKCIFRGVVVWATGHVYVTHNTVYALLECGGIVSQNL